MWASAIIHLLHGISLSELDARADSAIRALEDGTVRIPVTGDAHRADRITLCS